MQTNSFSKFLVLTSVVAFGFALPAGAATLDIVGTAGIDGVNGGAGGAKRNHSAEQRS